MSGRKTNVGRRDRIVRALLTPIALGAIVWLYTSVPQTLATLAAMGGLGLVAIVLGTGALTGTCGVYAALGFDTCSCVDEYAGGDTWG
ncbi:DUF2892 domain-containing protein [Halonotius terrestris]|uniref:DUF2892 domain-containing protein n=1 Tax=Halonotius terrestris TaxID=2487750 RepID=A0A8J8PAA0_9EURY|nr:DUF2892 domain-containing protein [Halonotius terrestris]TQQ82675.1 DUF2892 domain-containing protein [Halonotius terrestris]